MSANNKITFRVNDMTCNHCVKSITSAIEEAIPGAKVEANLGEHTVIVTGTTDRTKIAEAIKQADYTPEAI